MTTEYCILPSSTPSDFDLMVKWFIDRGIEEMSWLPETKKAQIKNKIPRWTIEILYEVTHCGEYIESSDKFMFYDIPEQDKIILEFVMRFG